MYVLNGQSLISPESDADLVRGISYIGIAVDGMLLRQTDIHIQNLDHDQSRNTTCTIESFLVY